VGPSSNGAFVPFASGVIGPADVGASNAVVIGFGSNSIITNTSSPVQYGSYAFAIPASGVLRSLEATVDLHYIPATAQASISYTFTLLKSNATTITDPSNPYVSTGFTTTVTFPAVTAATYSTGDYISNSNSTFGPFAVVSGDRIVLQLTSNIDNPPAIDEIGFQAGVFYSTP
jgi:hypothetical protein